MENESRERQEYWRGIAIQQLRKLAETELAFSEMEAEARISESLVFGQLKPQPHVVQPARSFLLRQVEIAEVTEVGRGGRSVKLYTVAETAGRAKAVLAATKRKRLLMNRYYGWSQGTESYAGITGPAAETVAHATILRSGIGTLLSNASAETGNIDSFLGQPVPIGPLDNGFLFMPLDDEGRLRLQTSVAVPVEVKNLREWIYPASRELYQLLTKSALLQQKLPDVPMVSLLIYRRASTTTHRMAKSMGFFVIQARQQFIQEHSRASHDAINEVREELGLFDLFVAEGPSIHIAAGLRAMKTKYNIVSSSKLWQSVANSELLVTRFRQLSQDMSTSKRSATMRDLRIIASEMSLRAGW